MIKKTIIIYGALAFLALLILGGVGWYVKTQQPVVIPPPSGEDKATGVVIPPATTNCTDELDVECWQTYRNEQYGFEFRFPGGWRVDDPGVEAERGPVDDFLLSTPNFIRNKDSYIEDGAVIRFQISANDSGEVSLKKLEFDGMGLIGKQIKNEVFNIGKFLAKEMVTEGNEYPGYDPLTDTDNIAAQPVKILSLFALLSKNLSISLFFNTGGGNRHYYLTTFEAIMNTFQDTR